MQSEKQKSFYYPELDGLRFFAFLLVFLNHAPYIANSAILRALHEFGWMGVDLFLCLSAFLITKLLIVENEVFGSINIPYFYARRILKIWPPYFLFTTFLIIYQMYNRDWNFTVIQRIAGMIFFSDNILAAVLGYNLLFSSVHLWTISYEEQFYIVIPWLIRKLAGIKNSVKVSLAIIILIFLSSIRAFFIYHDVSHPAIWVLPITHFESILGGIALGLGILDWFSDRSLLLTALISLGVVVLLPNIDITGWNLMLTYPLTGIWAISTISLVLRSNDSKIKRILKNKWIVYLGKISYGLYVYHLLCLTLANLICLQVGITYQDITLYPLAMAGLGMLLVIMLATTSYYIYERPFLIMKYKFASIKSRLV